MTGLERVTAVLSGTPPDRLPIVPILHTGLATICGVPLGRFFTEARTMARTLVEGYRRFGYDGIQLTLGVTGETAGARVALRGNLDPASVFRFGSEELVATQAAGRHGNRQPARRVDAAQKDVGNDVPLLFARIEGVENGRHMLLQPGATPGRDIPQSTPPRGPSSDRAPVPAWVPAPAP